jgi:hypothetical protein
MTCRSKFSLSAVENVECFATTTCFVSWVVFIESLHSAIMLLRIQLKMCYVFCIGHLIEYGMLCPKCMKQNSINVFLPYFSANEHLCGTVSQGYILCVDAGTSDPACHLRTRCLQSASKMVCFI